MHTNTETKFIKTALALSVISAISGLAAFIYEMLFTPEYKSLVSVPLLPYAAIVYSIIILTIVIVFLIFNKSRKSSNHFIACVIFAIITSIFANFFSKYDLIRIIIIQGDYNLGKRDLYISIFNYIIYGERFLNKCSIALLAIASGIISGKEGSGITNTVKQS